jgi:hypothetical protein
MFPSDRSRIARMSACRSDLVENGIDADVLGPRALSDLARRNLEYFQAMLGYEAGIREVMELIRRTGDVGHSERHRTRATAGETG